MVALDPYVVLGLKPGAKEAAIRAAYRRLARQYHPDVNHTPSAAAQMLDINAAYELLRDPEQRAAYDAEQARPFAEPRGAPGQTVWATYQAGQTASGPAAAAAWSGGDMGWTPAAATVVTPAASAVAASQPGAPAPVPGFFARYGKAVSVAGLSSGVLLMAGAVFAFTVMRAPAQAAPAPQVIESHVATIGGPGYRATAAAAGSVSSESAAAGAARTTQSAPAPLAPLPINGVGSIGVSGMGGAVVSAPGGIAPQAQAPLTQAPPAQSGSSASSALAQPPTAGGAGAEVAGIAATSAPSTAAVANAPSTASQPAPVSPRTGPAQTDMRAIEAQQGSGSPSISTAKRALSSYDVAWANYVGALRAAAAGSMASGRVSVDAQLAAARVAYLEQRLSWSRQESTTLGALGPAAAAHPDGDKAARAELRLNEAADLLSQAQGSGTLQAARVSALLGEADQLHRDSVAEWVTFLNQAG